jgi:hypothetical protein
MGNQPEHELRIRTWRICHLLIPIDLRQFWIVVVDNATCIQIQREDYAGETLHALVAIRNFSCEPINLTLLDPGTSGGIPSVRWVRNGSTSFKVVFVSEKFWLRTRSTIAAKHLDKSLK